MRDFADLFTERLAIAQIGGAREHIDLRAGIVDVILARNIVAGKRKQIGKRIAEHGSATVTDMHRSGGIDGDIFDVDLFGGAPCPIGRCAAEIRTECKDLT